MHSDFKKLINIVLIGLWLFLPIVLTTPYLISWILTVVVTAGIEPFSFVLAVLAALQVLIIASYQQRQRNFKTIIGILLSGWIIQVLSLVIVWNMNAGLQLEALAFLFWIPLSMIVAQVIVSITYFIFQFIGKKLRPSFFHQLRFPLMSVSILLVCALVVVNIYAITNQKQTRIAQTQNDSNFDISDISFRVDEKNTQLGKLDRPLRVFHTSEGYIGVSLSGEQIALSFLNAISTNKPDQLFLDVFNDKAYYIKEEMGYVYDLATKTTVTLPPPIQAALQEQFLDTFGNSHKRRIIATHKSYIALSNAELAGTGDVVIYDIHSGAKVFQTIYLGYDYNRLILFWLNNKGYRLILNAETEPTSYTDSVIGNTMSIYLDEHAEPYHRLSEDEIIDGIGKIVFSRRTDWFYKDKTPIYTFQSDYPDEKYGQSKFSIRNIYLLADGRIAIEIENALVLINLAKKNAEIVKDQYIITSLLDAAKLLSADDENTNRFLNQCGDDAYTQTFSMEKDHHFVFCLK